MQTPTNERQRDNDDLAGKFQIEVI